jgi:hypothetical protein
VTDGEKLALALGGSLVALAAGIGIAVAVGRSKSSGDRNALGRPLMLKKGNGTARMSTWHSKKNIPIKDRVGVIQDLIHDGVTDPDAAPALRKLALRITRDCPARDGKCESRAIYEWVRQNVRYTGDIAPHKHGQKGPYEPIDLFQRADRTLEYGGGDC